MARTIQTGRHQFPRSRKAGPSRKVKRDSSLDSASDATVPKKKKKVISPGSSSTAVDGEEGDAGGSNDDDVPDPAKWNDPVVFRPYRSFRRNDGGTSSIHVGEYVHLLGDREVGVAPGNVRWVGQVKGIRAKSPNEVYMSVKWCYNSVAQLKESGIPLPRGGLAENEVILSPFEDIVSVWSVEGQAYVVKYDEQDPWQEAIASDDEYHRSEIKVDKRRRRRVVPYHPTPKNEKPYRPLPYGSTPMTYCPRDGCRKWHHQGKLTKIGQPTPDQLAELATSGLETLTLPTRPKSTLDAEEINTNTQTTGDDPVKGSGSTSSKKSMKANGGAQADLELIRRFAEGSITRGDFSIVGNARSVLEAREIISMKDLGSGDWSEMIKSWKENHVPVEDEDEPEYRWLCPKCKGII